MLGENLLPEMGGDFCLAFLARLVCLVFCLAFWWFYFLFLGVYFFGVLEKLML